MKVSVVTPVFNEEAVLKDFFSRVTAVFDQIDKSIELEMIFVNDGSEDNSQSIIQEFCVMDRRTKLITLSRNFGHQSAIAAGMDLASGDAVVTIDCDLQDPPECILEMIAAWQAGADVVLAKRRSRSGESRMKLASAHLFYRTMSSLSSLELSKDVADFRLLSREVLEALNELSESNPYFRGLVNWVGFNQVEIEYDRDSRLAGESKYTLKKMIKLALSGLTSFSDRPLQLVSISGLFLMFSSLIAVAMVLVAKVIDPGRSVAGYVTLLIVILFLGGVQLFSIGILGLYLSVVNQNSKNRPRYVVSKRKSVNL
jgi:dolichol-phosphate mannosyltransferase